MIPQLHKVVYKFVPSRRGTLRLFCVCLLIFQGTKSPKEQPGKRLTCPHIPHRVLSMHKQNENVFFGHTWNLVVVVAVVTLHLTNHCEWARKWNECHEYASSAVSERFRSCLILRVDAYIP